MPSGVMSRTLISVTAWTTCDLQIYRMRSACCPARQCRSSSPRTPRSSSGSRAPPQCTDCRHISLIIAQRSDGTSREIRRETGRAPRRPPGSAPLCVTSEAATHAAHALYMHSILISCQLILRGWRFSLNECQGSGGDGSALAAVQHILEAGCHELRLVEEFGGQSAAVGGKLSEGQLRGGLRWCLEAGDWLHPCCNRQLVHGVDGLHPKHGGTTA